MWLPAQRPEWKLSLIMAINELTIICDEVVEAARITLVIGAA